MTPLKTEPVNELEYCKAFYEEAPVGFVTTNFPDGIVLNTNPMMIKMFKMDSSEELVGKPIANFWVYPEKRKALLRALVDNGEVLDYEVEMLRKDGSTCWISLSAKLFKETHHIISIVTDITHRKKLEEKVEFLKRKQLGVLKNIRNNTANLLERYGK